MNWENKLLSLFDDSIKDSVTVSDKTYTLDGKNVYMEFTYKNKSFVLQFVYRYSYISLDERPKNYIYTAHIFDKISQNYLFTKDIYTNNKLKEEDFLIKDKENERN